VELVRDCREEALARQVAAVTAARGMPVSERMAGLTKMM